MGREVQSPAHQSQPGDYNIRMRLFVVSLNWAEKDSPLR